MDATVVIIIGVAIAILITIIFLYMRKRAMEKVYDIYPDTMLSKWDLAEKRQYQLWELSRFPAYVLVIMLMAAPLLNVPIEWIITILIVGTILIVEINREIEKRRMQEPAMYIYDGGRWHFKTGQVLFDMRPVAEVITISTADVYKRAVARAKRI